MARRGAADSLQAPCTALNTARLPYYIAPVHLPPCVPAMLMVFHTLVRSLASMGNVTVVLGMVFLIFGILGVQARSVSGEG